MEEIKNLMKKRREYLLGLKREKEKALESAPEGFLRICKSRNRTQYYRRIDPKDLSGVYIRDKDVKLAKELAQKDYDQRIIKAIGIELESIENYFARNTKLYAEQVYENLHKERKKLITPIREAEEQFLENWKAVDYEGKGFTVDAPEFYTTRGERVRSKSEWIIGELLERNEIPYRYEYPIYLKGLGKIYPDFTILNVKRRKELYWEHFGMMDNPSYVEKAIGKIRMYEQNEIFPGENLIITYETSRNPISQKVVMILIQKYLQ